MDPLVLGFAFGAGLLSFFSPCAFPLIPGYLSYYLSRGSTDPDLPSTRLRLGLLAVFGVFAVMGVVSVLITLTGSALPEHLFHGFEGIVGGLLLVLGTYRVVSDRLSITLPVRAPAFTSDLSFFLFGATYTLLSMCCVLPLFLLVVVEALLAGGGWNGALVVLSYSAGLGIFMGIFALATTASRNYISSRFKTLMPRIRLAGGILILAAGSYMVYSYLTAC